MDHKDLPIGCKVVAVHFQGSFSPYNYRTDLPLKKGQVVVVDSRNNIGVAKVMNDNVTSEKGRRIATAWVLCVLNVNQHRKRIGEIISE